MKKTIAIGKREFYSLVFIRAVGSLHRLWNNSKKVVTIFLIEQHSNDYHNDFSFKNLLILVVFDSFFFKKILPYDVG